MMPSLNLIDMASRTMATKKWVQNDSRKPTKPARQDGSKPEATKVTEASEPRRKKSILYDYTRKEG